METDGEQPGGVPAGTEAEAARPAAPKPSQAGKLVLALVLLVIGVGALGAEWWQARQKNLAIEQGAQMAAPPGAPPGPGGKGGPGGPGGGKGGKGGGGFQAMLDQLKLTDEQKPKVKAVVDEYGPKMQALRGDKSMPAEQQRTAMGKLRDERNEKIKAVLTPEQQKQFDQLQAEAKAKYGKGGGKGGPGKGAPAGSGGPPAGAPQAPTTANNAAPPPGK